jgi:hypothetical protein
VDALVIIDADSTASSNLLRGFAGMLERGHEWIQCYYTVANPDASWRTKLMTYAFGLFNGVTPLGQFALGLSAGFRGNGMCLATRGLQRVPWTSYGLVEDMEYSWTVRLTGEKIAFLPDANVRGVMLGLGGHAAASQRRRWEFGRSALRKRLLLPLLRSRQLSWLEKLPSLIELTMPTLVVLLSICALLLALNLGILATGVSVLPAIVVSLLLLFSLLPILAMGLHALSPFLVFRMSWSYLLLAPYIPFYAIWKLLVALRGTPRHWERTSREVPARGGVKTTP